MTEDEMRIWNSKGRHMPMMKRDFRSMYVLSVALGGVMPSCSVASNPRPSDAALGESASGGTQSSGDSSLMGGAPVFAGTSAVGGTSGIATGGHDATGGASNSGTVTSSEPTNTGDVLATGGVTSTGGTRANGGTFTTGGNAGTGGSKATGGTSITGGARNAGGSSSSGGVSSTAGTQTTTGGMNSSGGTAATGGSKVAGGGTGNPGVRIVGRTAPGTNGSVRFSWPGVTINARFAGTQVSMDANDGNNKNRFTVVIDNGTPKTVTTTSGQTTLSLATGLTNGTHDLVIWRNTEASPGGITEFTGLSNFGSGGSLLAPPSAQDRRIEVIGDSLSAGAGDEGTSTSCSPNIDAFTNNYLAYGSVAARIVAADVVTLAWSGIGVYRSYSASDPTMPQRYDYAIPNDKTAWDFSKYQPHVVVINLGTNDFGSGNPGQPYVDAYVSFVKHLRSNYADGSFILIDMYGGDRATAINSVIASLKSSGESKVEMLSFASVPNNNTACNQHPNVAAQQAMGNLLATRLKSLMGW